MLERGQGNDAGCLCSKLWVDGDQRVGLEGGYGEVLSIFQVLPIESSCVGPRCTSGHSVTKEANLELGEPLVDVKRLLLVELAGANVLQQQLECSGA